MLRVIMGLAILVTTSGASIAETALDRGGYLVNAAAACATCHTPKTSSGPKQSLSGGTTFGVGLALVVASNITPDRVMGIGAWSDAEIIDAIRNDIRPDGSHLRPPMPQRAYGGMSDADAQAIVVYLRSIPPVSHAVPPPAVGSEPMPAKPIVRAAASPQHDDSVSRGRYIANALAHCTECHTPEPLFAEDFERHLDEGGRVFHTAKGDVVAPNITAERLVRYSDAALATIITAGVLPNGSRLRGPMPVAAYASLTDHDVAAVIAYLREPSQEVK